MKIAGEEIIHAPRSVVWRVLHDPELLKNCFKNCESLERKSTQELELVIAAKLGPFKTTHHVLLVFSNVVAPKSYRISAQGQGHIAGNARGTIVVSLSDVKDGTKINYRADVDVAASFSSFAATFIDSALNARTRDFFDRLAEQVQNISVESNQNDKVQLDKNIKSTTTKEKRKKPVAKKAIKKAVKAKKPAKAVKKVAPKKTPAAKKPVKKSAVKKLVAAKKPAKKVAKKTVKRGPGRPAKKKV